MADVSIKGIEGMNMEDIHLEVQSGAKFVLFQYCISIGIMTFRRSTDVYFLRAGQSPTQKGLKFTILTFFLGWWGIPWGFIYTPSVIYKNLMGGKDVTVPVLEHFHESISMSMEVNQTA